MRYILGYLIATIALCGVIPSVVESVDHAPSLAQARWSAPVSFAALGIQAAPANVGHHVTIKGPTEVPVGGLCILIVDGLKSDDSLSWVVLPAIEVGDLLDRQGRPLLVVPTNTVGTYHFVLAFSEGTKVAQKTHSVRVGLPTPPGPTPPTPVPPGPDPPAPAPTPDTKALTATYVYEKDQHTIPAAVLSGLNKLNRERKIIATIFEADTTDGGGQVPEQYKLALAEAKKAGLPALVVTGSKGLIRVVKAPTTEQQVLEAAP